MAAGNIASEHVKCRCLPRQMGFAPVSEPASFLALGQTDSRLARCGGGVENQCIKAEKRKESRLKFFCFNDDEHLPPVYFSFFLGRRLDVWPHFFLRQFLARGCSRA